MDDILNKLKGIFGGNKKKVTSPVPQNEQLTNPALLNWYANEKSREELARRQNQQRSITPYISPTAVPTRVPTPTAKPKAVANFAPQPFAAPTPDPRASWENFAGMVMREGGKRGYSGETLVRQKANESMWGQSEFAKKRYNYGGIGAYDRDPNQAFNFASPEEYLNYYFDLIEKNPRYAEAYSNRKDPRKYLEGLKKGGYASNPNYVEDVLGTRMYRNKPELVTRR